jgi:hypothetical protein
MFLSTQISLSSFYLSLLGPNLILSNLYRTVWLLLDSIHRLVCGSFTKDHNVSETGSVSVLRWMGRIDLLSWAHQKELVSITGRPHTRRWIESKRSQIVRTIYTMVRILSSLHQKFVLKHINLRSLFSIYDTGKTGVGRKPGRRVSYFIFTYFLSYRNVL